MDTQHCGDSGGSEKESYFDYCARNSSGPFGLPSEVWDIIMPSLDFDDLLFLKLTCRKARDFFDLIIQERLAAADAKRKNYSKKDKCFKALFTSRSRIQYGVALNLFDMITKSDLIMFHLARKNDKDAIKWFRNFAIDSRDSNMACSGAAKGGHLELCKWLNSKGYCIQQLTIINAAKSGSIPFSDWLFDKNSVLCHKIYAYNAAAKGHIHLLKYLRKKWNVEFTRDDLKNAAENGRLETVKWLHIKRRVRMDASTIARATQSGNLDLVQWLHENECPRDSLACTMAAEYEQYGILKWLYDNGYEMDKAVCRNLAKANHFEMFCWAVDRGAPFDALECLTYATNVDFRDWLIKNTHLDCSVDMKKEKKRKMDNDAISASKSVRYNLMYNQGSTRYGYIEPQNQMGNRIARRFRDGPPYRNTYEMNFGL